MILSKRGILDEGIYLTENGSEIIKKIKIKPAPVRRARPTGPKSATIRSNSCENMDLENLSRNIDKNDDENSRSSCEDKCDNDENQASEVMKTSVDLKKAAAPKRTVLLGLGGFNSKSRSRVKVANENETANDTENKTANHSKRKKKATIEDLIPNNMQVMDIL